MDYEEEQQAVYLISIEDSSDYWCGTYTELKLIYDKTFPYTSNGLKLKITPGTINEGIKLGDILEYKDTTCEEVGHKYNQPIKGNFYKNKFDIKIYEKLPENKTTIASGMCGGCITITIVLSNDRLIRGHFESLRIEEGDEFVFNFFNQMKDLVDAEILEIRIYAPIASGIPENQVIAANGVLKSLEILRKIGLPLNKVVYIEGTNSEYVFWKNVNETETTDLMGVVYTPEIITDVNEIESNMQNIIQKSQSKEETLQKVLAKVAADKAFDEREYKPLTVEEIGIREYVGDEIWGLAEEAVANHNWEQVKKDLPFGGKRTIFMKAVNYMLGN